RLLGGQLTHPDLAVDNDDARYLAQAIIERDLYVRSFAFRPQFMLNIPDGKDSERESERVEMFNTAKALAPHLDGGIHVTLAEDLRPVHVIADLAPNRPFALRVNTRTS